MFENSCFVESKAIGANSGGRGDKCATAKRASEGHNGMGLVEAVLVVLSLRVRLVCNFA